MIKRLLRTKLIEAWDGNDTVLAMTIALSPKFPDEPFFSAGMEFHGSISLSVLCGEGKTSQEIASPHSPAAMARNCQGLAMTPFAFAEIPG
jgi:hypothetical protein